MLTQCSGSCIPFMGGDWSSSYNVSIKTVFGVSFAVDVKIKMY